jgi:hypothetical protein
MIRRFPFILTLLLIGTLFFSLDLFLHPGEPATFDGPIHITNMAMYARALRDGDVPVTWADGFANYGLPTPLLSQQLSSYLGAFFILLGMHPVMAFKVLVTIAGALGGIGMYGWLRLYAKEMSALTGSWLFLFSAYRITNVYVRGALPEVLALSIIPFVLIGCERIFRNKSHGFVIYGAALTLLIAAHPFVFFISLFLLIPYGVYLSLVHRKKIERKLAAVFVGVLLALGLNAWYLFPLLLEMKYFVIARNTTQLVPDQFLGWNNYFVEKWRYFTESDVFVRANDIQLGLIETFILLVGLPFLGWVGLKETKNRWYWWVFLCGTTLFVIFLTTRFAEVLYTTLPYLHAIQFPWRFLSLLILLSALVWALVLERVKYKEWLGVGMIGLLLLWRLPMVYGKNFTVYPLEHYTRTIKNLHFDSLNTIWTGNTLEYPVKDLKGEIIEGEGRIVSRIEENSYRRYEVEALGDLRVVDYTFYFPGWRVYVDGKETEIEFQDTQYRGVITYRVPQGSRDIVVVFEPTKVRQAGYIVTLATMGMVIGYAVVRVKKR